jgi:hypothetical protein
MKIKHRIIGEYATKCCYFDLKKLTIVFKRIQRERGIEVLYLPNGTNAGYM